MFIERARISFLGKTKPETRTPATADLPTGVARATFEIWGAGGNGHGACSCNRCQIYAGAQGGYYATRTIAVTPGDTYTVCAAGVYRC